MLFFYLVSGKLNKNNYWHFEKFMFDDLFLRGIMILQRNSFVDDLIAKGV